ncbi:hypothetical protein LTS16_018030 [Friedmanniomyces endolithicus]|uniref:RNA polymerase II holoenzyme cyclin-like subunit n=1 Tax=Friedmanniomyces endolithicus TaxID=329885 RepID=A0A4U0UM33_9PEZI|nr:hypothetical protein LTS09_013608 [Friedmanniomyces endolithicus]KAK0266841.1 hypothetical protein LTR35_016754 [Friedmanniomyces endolithicus]KAK0824887.1 hypothetical protein LTR73_007440 [Friedmanniomyces endolithicus]KAK1031417.1 hypothetical protein LTS16_018030 [Friedmanniomyces endolithicus]TKA36282.1 hypothetical protein B0A54_13216 [Friedmanniomyces endolithicus]
MPPPSKTDHLPPSHPAHRQRPRSPNRVLAEAEAQWIFTEAELDNSPTIQDGMSIVEERETRAKGINFITSVGVMLKLPQITLATAAIYFQRYLMRGSLKKARGDMPKLHHYQIAAISLFLATKVEESSRALKEMIVAFCRVAQKNPNLLIDDQSKDYWKWKDCILIHEDVMLETLCFDLTVESPHRQLFDLLKCYGVEHNKRVRNAAWAFITDGNNTQLCLLISSRTIAVAGVYAACRSYGVTLPDDDKGRPWWEVQGVRLKDVRRAMEFMEAGYEETSNKINGVAAAVVQGAGKGSGSEGERSIYVGLSSSTPAHHGCDGVRDGWDSTRLRGEQVASPFVIPPVEGERRASNASSIGEKRKREDAQVHVAVNGNDKAPAKANGTVETAEPGNKRPRIEEVLNGKPPPQIELEGGGGAEHDVKHEEERLRVRNGNRQAEAVQKTANANGTLAPPKNVTKDDAEVSEEGEVEE